MRKRLCLFIGVNVEPAEARRFLAVEWQRYEAPLEYGEAELARLLKGVWSVKAVPADWRERVAEAVRKSCANVRLIQQWLNQQA